MHEAGLIRALLRRAEEEAARHGGRVRGLRVWLGALSHCSPEHFREHWLAESAGTPWAEVALELETSDDLDDPRADGVVLLGLELEEG